jgi:multisubunit Na+/H+ antiporter MnhC subunit
MKNYPINEIYGMDLYSSVIFISAVISLMFGFMLYVFLNINMFYTIISSSVFGTSLCYIIIYKANVYMDETEDNTKS